MTEYAICFDFPEGGDPWFAGLVSDMMGFVGRLSDALKFDSEESAARVLTTYGDGTRPHGSVVEVAA